MTMLWHCNESRLSCCLLPDLAAARGNHCSHTPRRTRRHELGERGVKPSSMSAPPSESAIKSAGACGAAPGRSSTTEVGILAEAAAPPCSLEALPPGCSVSGCGVLGPLLLELVGTGGNSSASADELLLLLSSGLAVAAAGAGTAAAAASEASANNARQVERSYGSHLQVEEEGSRASASKRLARWSFNVKASFMSRKSCNSFSRRSML